MPEKKLTEKQKTGIAAGAAVAEAIGIGILYILGRRKRWPMTVTHTETVKSMFIRVKSGTQVINEYFVFPTDIQNSDSERLLNSVVEVENRQTSDDDVIKRLRERIPEARNITIVSKEYDKDAEYLMGTREGLGYFYAGTMDYTTRWTM